MCSRNKLLLSKPLTYRDPRDISRLISREKRQREREAVKKRLMQLQGESFHPLLTKVRRIGIREIAPGPSTSVIVCRASIRHTIGPANFETFYILYVKR